MARNGSGTFTLVAGNPVVTGTTISSTTHNNTMNDLATALTQSVSADGQTPITANLPMNGFRHTGVQNAVSANDYAAYGQILPITGGSLTGGLLIAAPAGLGYGAGAGGTVTQATSKSTTVTLNNTCGQITTNNSALASNDRVTFQVINSKVSSTDIVTIAIANTGSASYKVNISYTGVGVFFVLLESTSPSSQSDYLLINFAIIKGSTS